MPDVLTKEQVAVAKNAVLEGRWPAKELMELADSHERLRARIAELERERRDVAFMEAEYLKAHGGAWGVCKYQAQLAVARAFLNTYDNEDACAGDRIDAANRLRAALDGLKP